MWTTQNRKRYDRSQLRYPSDLTDEEWAYVAPCDPAGQARRQQTNSRYPGGDERGHVCLEHGLPMARAAQGPAAEEHGA